MKNKKTSEQEIGKNIVKPLQIITNRDIKVNKKRTVKKMCHINTQNTLQINNKKPNNLKYHVISKNMLNIVKVKVISNKINPNLSDDLYYFTCFQ